MLFSRYGTASPSEYAVALCLLLLSTSLPASSPIEKQFTVSVVIEDRFSSSYEILGSNGNALTQGHVSLSPAHRLTTLRGIPITVWQVSPDGGSRTQVNNFRMKWTEVSAQYTGSGTDETIPSTLIRVSVDYRNTPMGSSIDLSSQLSGHNLVAVYSEEALPDSAFGNNGLVVHLAGVFENVIE